MAHPEGAPPALTTSQSNGSFSSANITPEGDDNRDPEKAIRPLRTAPTLNRSVSRVESTLSQIRSRKPVPPFGHPLASQKTGPDVIVEFEGPDDPYLPRNWAFQKKVVTTFLYGLTTMGSTWASSVLSPGIVPIAEEFHIGRETATLTTTLLLVGFGLGPLLW